MFSTLRTRFGIPGVISVIALVFAMFGGAYAASQLQAVARPPPPPRPRRARGQGSEGRRRPGRSSRARQVRRDRPVRWRQGR